MVINHLLSGMVLQESAPPAMPAQKGKSCLERRLKRCQTDVQMQGQPLQPCIAPRVQRGHPSSRAKILQRALHDACANKNLFTKTPPHQRKNTTTGSQKHHHITPPQKYHHTTTKTPPHHHHNNKPPLGTEPMTSPLLSGCNANWAKLPLPCGKKGAHPLWNWKKVPPPHHHKNTTTPNTKTPPHQTQKHNQPTTKTQPHHHKNTTTPPPQKHHHTITKTQPPHHHKNTTISTSLVLRAGWAACGTTSGTTSSCEEQTLFGDNAATCGSATTGTNMLHIQDTSKHAGLFFLHFQICWAARWSVQGHHHGRTQTMSGLEDRLSCMWNDVWNDVKTTSRRRDLSTWQ